MTQSDGFPLVKVSSLREHSLMPKFQDLGQDDFVHGGTEPHLEGATIPALAILGMSETIHTKSNFKQSGVRHFISHRWLSHGHPDPEGTQLRQILEEFDDECLIWYDYCCLPQEPLSNTEKSALDFDLARLPDLIRTSWFYVIADDVAEYNRRGWCAFESFCARNFGLFPTKTQQSEQPHINAASQQTARKTGLTRIWAQAMASLPKRRANEDPYVRGYYLDVPELDDAVFAEFKQAFFALDTTIESDKVLMWNILRQVFPAREVANTYTPY